MSPLLQRVLEDIDQLTLEEQFEVIHHTTQQLQSRTTTPTPKLNWLDIAGIAPYPLLGEDAQEWVSRTRQEAQDHRDRLVGSEHEG
jgi:hypothetical protein